MQTPPQTGWTRNSWVAHPLRLLQRVGLSLSVCHPDRSERTRAQWRDPGLIAPDSNRCDLLTFPLAFPQDLANPPSTPPRPILNSSLFSTAWHPSPTSSPPTASNSNSGTTAPTTNPPSSSSTAPSTTPATGTGSLNPFAPATTSSLSTSADTAIPPGLPALPTPSLSTFLISPLSST